MNLAEIETFLTIVNTKSITRTADLLFLSHAFFAHNIAFFLVKVKNINKISLDRKSTRLNSSHT